jgi:DNA-binding CsgD family transcriptional regulator
MVILTKAEKERRVKELLEQGKSTREIADEVHMSFGDIGSIRRRLFGETEVQTKNEGEVTVSTDTKVFKMFEQGKTPIEVAIELDLKSDSVARLL